MYFRNILGMAMMLFSIYFLGKSKTNKKYLWWFVIIGGLLGAMHMATFYIFGLAYFFYAILSPYKNKRYNFKELRRNVLRGIFILLIAGSFYLGKFSEAVFNIAPGVLEGFAKPGQASGTFIDFFTYQFSVLAYLPFTLLGLFSHIKNKKFNMITLGTLITLAIVYFQFFFFNRFIIHLDIFLIILAGLGGSILIQNKKRLGTILLVIIFISSAFAIFNHANNVQNVISENEIQTIEYLQNTPEGSFVMSTDKIYSPWILGYSGRKTIAPGLFDYNLHNKKEWINFWTTDNIEEIRSFMDSYEKPLYIFIGEKQRNNLAQFNESGCFEVYLEDDDNFIYSYIC
jgi:hypothetical protein